MGYLLLPDGATVCKVDENKVDRYVQDKTASKCAKKILQTSSGSLKT